METIMPMKWGPMEAIYSSTALQNNLREIKDIARKQLVHITENGNGAFVFCSEEQLDRELAAARAEAAEEARLSLIVERGRDDIANGRVYRGTQAAREEVAKRVSQRG